MLSLALLPALVLLANDASEGWTEVTKTDGFTVYSRVESGTTIAEMKVVGPIDAPPHDVWKTVRDYPNYAARMPYTDEGKLMGSEGGDKVLYFYSVVNAPLVDRRDYCIRIVDESVWNEGKGYLLMTWRETPKCPSPREGLVRVKATHGSWKLEPTANGTKTNATYVIYTDPGGDIPKWIVNQGNSTVVGNIFATTRKWAVKERAAASR